MTVELGKDIEAIALPEISHSQALRMRSQSNTVFSEDWGDRGIPGWVLEGQETGTAPKTFLLDPSRGL